MSKLQQVLYVYVNKRREFTARINTQRSKFCKYSFRKQCESIYWEHSFTGFLSITLPLLEQLV